MDRGTFDFMNSVNSKLGALNKNLENISKSLDKHNELLEKLIDHLEVRDKEILCYIEQVCAIKYNV